MPSFYEFFAGGGMARQGLGPGWTCLFANDFDPGKAWAYRRNHGGEHFKLGDIRDVVLADLPGVPDIVWGSFPCQDLSLAGGGAGLTGERSGTFYPFWEVITALRADGRAPRLVALENVCGTLTSHGGRDFEAICATFAQAGYRCGALVIDAELFVPQSRPRLFMIGVREDLGINPGLLAPGPEAPFHTPALRKAVEGVSPATRSKLLWWRLPQPAPRSRALADEIEDPPAGVAWHSPTQTQRLLALMSPLHLAKVEAAKRDGRRWVGGVYRRTRADAAGVKRQRAEVRFDGVAGCLRTPAGGSSRQTLLVVEGAKVRSRLISAREAARLMGLDDGYELPKAYSDAYHLLGDGVVVPVVRHLARELLEPLLAGGVRDTAAWIAGSSRAMTE